MSDKKKRELLVRTFGGKTLKGKRITIRPATASELEARKHWSVGVPLGGPLLRDGAPCPRCGGTRYHLAWHPPTVYRCLACGATILSRGWKDISPRNPPM